MPKLDRRLLASGGTRTLCAKQKGGLRPRFQFTMAAGPSKPNCHGELAVSTTCVFSTRGNCQPSKFCQPRQVFVARFWQGGRRTQTRARIIAGILVARHLKTTEDLY